MTTLNEQQLREQDYRLYGPEVAQARAEKRQRDWIERELSVSRESSSGKWASDHAPVINADSSPQVGPATIHGADTSPVTDPQSYSRNDARKGSAGVNLKDWRNYL